MVIKTADLVGYWIDFDGDIFLPADLHEDGVLVDRVAVSDPVKHRHIYFAKKFIRNVVLFTNFPQKFVRRICELLISEFKKMAQKLKFSFCE